eukprot:4549234-Pyramimonas_sp.AAC.1
MLLRNLYFSRPAGVHLQKPSVKQSGNGFGAPGCRSGFGANGLHSDSINVLHMSSQCSPRREWNPSLLNAGDAAKDAP